MAKKGGVQQLQADIQTDEDFEKFIERPGLLVLDVYSEWCGPCLGMVGSLKKIKLELGGDNLQLAICKSDTISYLKRFNKKSEPTWLFVTNGKAVNLMFGTNVPKLMRMIAQELRLLDGKVPRNYYAITEMQPEEIQRNRVKEDAEAEAVAIELAEAEKKRKSYLMYVTDMVIENLPDVGVTLFGPQVNRDMFKKITEPADQLKLQCKDRRVVPVTKENFEVINFACSNPLDENIIKLIDGKELLVCFWKVPDEAVNNVAGILQKLAHELTKTPAAQEGDDEGKVYKPILPTLIEKVEEELEEGKECPPEEEEPPPPKPKEETKEDAKPEIKAVPSKIEGDEEAAKESEESAAKEGEVEGEEGEGKEKTEVNAEAAEEKKEEEDAMAMLDFELDLGLDEEDKPEEDVKPVVEEPPKKRTCTRTYKIPPVWVPSNHRTHAAMVYVFFRQQTTPFLPPDPVPEPPHVVMAFDAYKKKDLISVAERYKDDVMSYGFFTSDDAEDAKLIANTVTKYLTKPQNASDKLVFKIAKTTSHTMLSFATNGPSYVSPNTVVGKEEALKFFPPGYSMSEDVVEKAPEPTKDSKKRKKSKKESAADAAPTAAAAEGAAPIDEGATTTSGEESGEDSARRGQGSEPPTSVEGDGTEAALGTETTPTEAPAEDATPTATEGATAAEEPAKAE